VKFVSDGDVAAVDDASGHHEPTDLSHGEELSDDNPTESPPPPLYDGQQCFCCLRTATL